MKDIVIVDGARTPMAEYNGHFSDISAIDLGVIAAKEAIQRSGFTPDLYVLFQRVLVVVELESSLSGNEDRRERDNASRDGDGSRQPSSGRARCGDAARREFEG